MLNLEESVIVVLYLENSSLFYSIMFMFSNKIEIDVIYLFLTCFYNKKTLKYKSIYLEINSNQNQFCKINFS